MIDFNPLLDAVEGVAGRVGELPRSPEVMLEFEPWEYVRRCARAAAAMGELDLDAIVLSQPANVRYFTGLQTWLWKPLIPVVAILTAEIGSSTILASAMDEASVRATAWPATPRFYASEASPADAIADTLADLGLKRGRVGLEIGREQLSFLAAGVFQDIRRALPEARFFDAVPVAAAVRMLKSDAEIERLREAARITEHGFASAWRAARDGVSEADLAMVAASSMVREGSLPGFAPLTLICRAGPASYTQFVGFPGDEPVRSGQQIFFDGGCEYRGYQTDIMRSAVIGELDAAAERHFALLDRAITHVIAQLRVGRPLAEARTAVTEFARSNDLMAGDEVYGIGHGIGLDRWELPLISEREPYGNLTARAGMVLCVEPSIGRPPGASANSGLFLMEDEVLINDDGAEVLSAATPRTLCRLPLAA